MTDTTDTGTGSLEALQGAIGWTAEQRVDVVERRHLPGLPPGHRRSIPTARRCR